MALGQGCAFPITGHLAFRPRRSRGGRAAGGKVDHLGNQQVGISRLLPSVSPGQEDRLCQSVMGVLHAQGYSA